jgi:hypothetical protein
MRQLTYVIAVTLDGYIATGDGAADFFPWEGDHGPATARDHPLTRRSEHFKLGVTAAVHRGSPRTTRRSWTGGPPAHIREPGR